jgi:hypothetical protein
MKIAKSNTKTPVATKTLVEASTLQRIDPPQAGNGH